MQFQHATSLQPTLVQRTTKGFLSATTAGIIIPGGTSNFTIIIQEIVVGYSVTTGGEIIFQIDNAQTNALIVEIAAGTGTLNINVPGEQIKPGTYGYRVTDLTTGGGLFYNVWYSIYQN